MFEAPISHLSSRPAAERYNPALLEALAAVSAAEPPRPRSADRRYASADASRPTDLRADGLLGDAAGARPDGPRHRQTGGQGFYGETTDKVITNAMFLMILFFPTVIIVFSLIQWRLDKRKHARMDAAKRRAANADWRGGW